METNAAIASRRSIRKYKPDPIDPQVMDRLMEAVRNAPSWGNTQTCRVVIVTDPSAKNALADIMFGLGNRPNPADQAVRAAPIAVAFCAELGRAGFLRSEPPRPATDKGEYWYMFDVALAMENFVLAAQSYHLGTVIVGAFDAAAAAKILNVPTGFTVVALTPLGIPDESPEARPRKLISEIVFKEQFGAH
jgi:nitroreductase